MPLVPAGDDCTGPRRSGRRGDAEPSPTVARHWVVGTARRRTWTGTPVLVAVAVALVAAGCGGGSGSAQVWKPPRTVVPPWTTPAVLPAPSTATAWQVVSPAFVPAAIDCVTAAVCHATAFGGPASATPAGLGVSDDGGRTWHWQAAPGGVTPTALACATVDRCWAVADGYVDATSDGGARWTAAPLPGFRRHVPLAVAAISCPSAVECVAAGTAGSLVPEGSQQAAYVVRTDDGGAAWQALALPAGTPLLQSVSCPTARRCLAVGGRRILLSDSHGRRWRQQAAPAPARRLVSVTCSTATRCVAVGTEVAHPAVGGGSTGPLALVTGDGGARWQVVPLPSAVAVPTRVACAPAGPCVVSGTDTAGTPTLAWSVDGGRTWTAAAAPDPAGSAGYVDCPPAGPCLDATASGLFALDPAAPGSWTDLSTPSPFPTDPYDTPAAVSCPAPGHCTVASRYVAFAGGGSAAPFPLALTTTDAGATWTSSAVDNGRVDLQPGLSCPTASTCQLADSAGLFRTTDGGASWARQPLPSPPGPAGTTATSVSCPDADACMVVGLAAQGTGVLATADAGRTWTASVAPAGVGVLAGVSCTTATACVAVGATPATPTSGTPEGVALTTADQGGAWHRAEVPAGTVALAAVSCPTADRCVAVGGDPTAAHPAGVALTSSDGGASWTTGAVPAGSGPLSAVSCPSASVCVAVGAGALVTFDGGRRWTAVPLPAGTGTLTGVSCAGTGDCTAVGAFVVLTTTALTTRPG